MPIVVCSVFLSHACRTRRLNVKSSRQHACARTDDSRKDTSRRYGSEVWSAQIPACLPLQDLSRADIHRIGPPHEKEFGGMFWAHLLHHHVGIDLHTFGTSTHDMSPYATEIRTPIGLSLVARHACANVASSETCQNGCSTTSEH